MSDFHSPAGPALHQVRALSAPTGYAAKYIVRKWDESGTLAETVGVFEATKYRDIGDAAKAAISCAEINGGVVHHIVDQDNIVAAAVGAWLPAGVS
jgi:hypothetical protein